MHVLSFTHDTFNDACRHLGATVRQAFRPDLIVGIRTGGWVVAQSVLAHEPTDLPLLPITRRRPTSDAKNKTPIFRQVLRHLPYAVTDRARILEHRYITLRRRPETASKAWHPEPREGEALREAIRRNPGARVLVVDDSVDTGTTLRAVRQYLEAASSGVTVRTAVITVTSPQPVEIPDFTLHQDTLCRFPWSHDFKH